MDLQSNVNELITLRTNGVEDAMKSMKDIESLFDKVTSNYRPLLNGERCLSDVEVSHRLKVSRRTLQNYRDRSTCGQNHLFMQILEKKCATGGIVGVEVAIAVDGGLGLVGEIFPVFP